MIADYLDRMIISVGVYVRLPTGLSGIKKGLNAFHVRP